MLSSQLQHQQKRNVNKNGESELGSPRLSVNHNNDDLDKESEESGGLEEHSILKHVQECKTDNKLRLKQVRNLEELIKFRIKTVTEQLMQDGTIANDIAQNKSGLHELRKVVDPLLTSSVQAITSKKQKNPKLPVVESVDDDEQAEKEDQKDQIAQDENLF